MSMFSIIEECFTVWNGILAIEKLGSDSFNDFKLDTEHMDTFIEERYFEKTKKIFDPLKRVNVETFSTSSKCVTFKCKGKDIPLVKNKNLFAKLIIIMQKRSIYVKKYLNIL